MRTVIRNFFAPVFVGRGVVQISAYVGWLASPPCCSTGAVAALAYAQILYTSSCEPLRNVGFGCGAAADVRCDRRRSSR